MFTAAHIHNNVSIVGIGGSTRAGSRNGSALTFALESARALGAQTRCFDLHSSQFPILDGSLKLEDYPEIVAEFITAVRQADGIVLASPTYHGAMSGAFKNVLDLLYYGDDKYFNRKPVGVMALGGANAAPAIEMITTTVHSLKGLVMPSRVVIPHGTVGSNGVITDPGVCTRINLMIDELIDVATMLRQGEETANMVAMAGA